MMRVFAVSLGPVRRTLMGVCILLATASVGRAQDGDLDGVLDVDDNCPELSNPSQNDWDFDDVGDECDNCPFNHNDDQADLDLDGLGNVCDNCIVFANPGQENDDGTGPGDACDWRWADLAPPGAPDGVIDVGDVIRVLRFVAGLEVPTAEERERANVAPAWHHGEHRVRVAVDGVTALAGVGFHVTHDPVNLTFQGAIALGPVSGGFTQVNDSVPGLIRFSAARATNGPLEGETDVARFRYTHEVHPGDASLHGVVEGTCDVADEMGHLLSDAVCRVRTVELRDQVAVPEADPGGPLEVGDVILVLRAAVGLSQFSLPGSWPRPTM